MAQKAFGTKFYIGTVAAGTEVADITSITCPTLSVDKMESTTHDQADEYKTYISGLKDWGEVECEVRGSVAFYDQIVAVVGTDDQAFGIEVAGSAVQKFDFLGIITEFTPIVDAELDGQYMGSFKLQISGDVTETNI